MKRIITKLAVVFGLVFLGWVISAGILLSLELEVKALELEVVTLENESRVAALELEVLTLELEVLTLELEVTALEPEGQVAHGLPIARYLSDNGLLTGTKVATGDYSVTSETFLIRPPADTTFLIRQMIVTIECPTDASSSTYCDLESLPNGLTFIMLVNEGITVRFDGSLTIHSNTDWAEICYDITFEDIGSVSGPGSDNNFVRVRCTFMADLKLNGAKGEALGVLLEDDFSGLASHKFFVTGEIL